MQGWRSYPSRSSLPLVCPTWRGSVWVWVRSSYIHVRNLEGAFQQTVAPSEIVESLLWEQLHSSRVEGSCCPPLGPACDSKQGNMVRELPSLVHLDVPLPEGVGRDRNVVDACGPMRSIVRAGWAMHERQSQVCEHRPNITS